MLASNNELNEIEVGGGGQIHPQGNASLQFIPLK